FHVTGVQTCALPICRSSRSFARSSSVRFARRSSLVEICLWSLVQPKSIVLIPRRLSGIEHVLQERSSQSEIWFRDPPQEIALAIEPGDKPDFLLCEVVVIR